MSSEKIPSGKGASFTIHWNTQIIFLRATTDFFIRIIMQNLSLGRASKETHRWSSRYKARKGACSIIMKMGVPKDVDHGHMGNSFSACNHYDFRSNDYSINTLAKFHAPLSGRSRDMDDDKVLLN